MDPASHPLTVLSPAPVAVSDATPLGAAPAAKVVGLGVGVGADVGVAGEHVVGQRGKRGGDVLVE